MKYNLDIVLRTHWHFDWLEDPLVFICIFQMDQPSALVNLLLPSNSLSFSYMHRLFHGEVH